MSDESRPRVTVIDDDRLVRRVVASALEQKGYAVIEGESGATALRLARDRPDLLILDFNMPDLNGLAVCRALRAAPQTSDVPIMFLTASHDERTVVACLQAGANDYISKPFAPAVLEARVDVLVKAHRAERARKKAMEELHAAYDALKESRAEAALNQRLGGLGILAAGLAHEMNSPLGALFSCLDFALEEPDDKEEVRNALKDARASAMKVAELVKRMKAIGGGTHQGHAEFDLRAECEGIGRMFSAMPCAMTVTGDPVIVWGEVAELHQAIMALVENAVQAAQGRADARVEVRVRADGERAEVVVDDNGPGIDDADLPFVFDPFFTKKRVWQTPGLGLSIARAAARRHGGDVELEPHGPLGGVRARLVLPLRRPAEPALHP